MRRQVLTVLVLGTGVVTCAAPSGAPTGPRPVATVTLSPGTASIPVSQTVQLTATPRDANGNPVSGRALTWASRAPTVATVSSNGLVTGVAAGTDTITATCDGQTGSATVTVTGAAPPPTILLQESFSDHAFAARGWYDNTSLAIDSTQHIPGSAASLQVHFLTAATQPTWGGGTRHLFTPTSTLYVSYWIAHSANWVGSGFTYDPHLFHVLSTLDATYAGPAAAYLDALLEENYQKGQGGVLGRVILQDARNINATPTPPWPNTGGTESRAVAGCNGVPDSLPATCYADGNPYTGWNNGKFITTSAAVFSDVTKSAWHHVEIYLAMNSVVGGVGQLDGIVRYWVDGVLVMQHTNVLFRTGQRATMQFQQLMIAPYLGSGSPVDQTLWIDGLTVATGKP